jgi:hypothetical protein
MFLYHLDTLPKKYIGNRIGGTDYIDFLSWKEITEPAMMGVDCYSRYFIVIKFLINRKDKEPEKIMQTFFQRHSYSKLWMGCGHATQNLMWTDGGMKQEQFQFLDRILKGEILEIPNNINSIYPDGTVSLYDEKKWKAVEKIQKQWRLCRYNPRYKMCETVQMRNYETILNEA